MTPWVPRLAAATAALVVASVVALVGLDGSPSSLGEHAGPSTSSTSSTAAEPERFPAIDPDAPMRAVQTPTGLVLPVVGGAEGAWEVLTPCADRSVTPGEGLRGAHVVLDPGHGGSETGAVGPAGLVEKDVNLDIAVRVAALLRDEGATVVLTRTADVRVTIETRTQLARALDPLVFVSIHHNGGSIGVSDRPGPELYHQLDDVESRRLAGLLWEELAAGFTPYADEWAIGDGPGARARRSIETGDDYYGILRGAQGVPTVLSEALYLSDPSEEQLLLDEDFRQTEATAITRAILRHVGTDDPGSGYVATKVSDVPAGGGGGRAGCEDPPLS